MTRYSRTNLIASFRVISRYRAGKVARHGRTAAGGTRQEKLWGGRQGSPAAPGAPVGRGASPYLVVKEGPHRFVAVWVPEPVGSRQSVTNNERRRTTADGPQAGRAPAVGSGRTGNRDGTAIFL